jgi:hypothetical protein
VRLQVAGVRAATTTMRSMFSSLTFDDVVEAHIPVCWVPVRAERARAIERDRSMQRFRAAAPVFGRSCHRN